MCSSGAGECATVKVCIMKKILFGTLACVFVCDMANAGVKYTETETVTTIERFYTTPRRGVRARPCVRKVAEPVRVKSHTEVIEYYNVYQPVTIYQPVGTEIKRHIVPVKSCNKCRK